MADFPANVIDMDQERFPTLRRLAAYGGDSPTNTAGNIRERALNEAGELQFINPSLRYGVELSIANLQGDTGLQPQARINPSAVGLTAKQADDLGEQFEDIYREWAMSPAANGDDATSLVSTMQAGLRRAFGTGELLLQVGWRKSSSARWSTYVKPLDPQRIARFGGTKPLLVEGSRVIQGVEINDATGRIDALWIRGNQPAYGFTQVEMYKGIGDRFEMKTKWGRPQLVFAVMDRLGPGVVRGVSPLLSALEQALRLDDLSDLTHEQLRAQLQISWALYSDLSMDEANAAVFGDKAKRLEMTNDYLDRLEAHMAKAPFTVPKGAKLSILPQGAKLAPTNPSLPGMGLEAITRRLYLELSRALGLSYADLTSDYANETYSSSRTGQVGPWAITKHRRASFLAPAYGQVYDAVIEEALLKGYVKLPSNAAPFYANRAAYTASSWTGPARPIVDPEKEANANDIELANGTASLESIASERGQDWREIVEQRAAEAEYCRKRGVTISARGINLLTGEAISGNSKAPAKTPANTDINDAA